MGDLDVAVLLTCHNRRVKTIACLKSLFSSLDNYNSNHHDSKITLKVFVVDDGCTDGTSAEIKKTFVERINIISIIQGDGSLYWAGGMRLAWRSSLEEREDWNFFLLVNDDTVLYKDSLESLLQAHNYTIEKYGKSGIYSGITCSIGNSAMITYGGVKWRSRTWAKVRLLGPIGKPQMCDAANANILLVSRNVYNKLGGLNHKYRHGFADYEYSMNARKKGFPVLVTAGICGECNYDHKNPREEILKMNLSERKLFFSSPLNSIRDYLLYMRRNFPICFPFILVGRFLILYYPCFYYKCKDILSLIR